ncbi:MAG: cysteine rich repeat-containing protein [Rhodomicrobium sp.]
MRIFAGVIAVLTIVSLSGFADARVKLKHACGADLEKFCKDVKKGEGRKACLRTHASELQPGCADALKERDAEKAAKKNG